MSFGANRRSEWPSALSIGRCFVGLYRFSPKVLHALKILKPETVLDWHHCGVRVGRRELSRLAAPQRG
jgi:hypothetical protein